MNKNNEIRMRKPLSVRAKLLIFFSCFAAAILVIIWVFQVRMLDYFYRQTKLDELSHISTELTESIGSDELEARAVELSMTYDTCISVYSAASGRLGNELVSADITPTCLLHHLQASDLNSMYLYALENGGEWFGENTSYVDGNGEEDGASGELFRSAGKEISALYVKAVNLRGDDYVIILNTEFMPMNSTVRTLAKQFGWIAVAVLVAAALMAAVFSNIISKPLADMNRAAKRLALGEYEPSFREEGYLEARELAKTLNYAATEIGRSDSLQRELIANVSHDLRTPLTMISGYSEVMRDIPGENTPENLQIVIDEAGRLSELVTDMLDISRLRAGTRTPEMTFFDLTETVREVLKRYEKLTSHDGYTIDLELNGEVCVYADRTMILQVIYNLINNAINYTGEDKRVKVTQTISECASGRSVRISVTDTGAGIPREQIPLIWDRYYKIDKVHRRAAVGTGLGLSIVKGVLRAHNAAYGVESREGEGSTFWFELPEAETPSDARREQR